MSSDKLDNLIILPADGSIDSGGIITTPVPLEAIDPSHHKIEGFLKNSLLADRVRKGFIQDAINTGHLVERDKDFLFITKRSFESFFGLLMESYLVRLINNYPDTVGHRAKNWAMDFLGPLSFSIDYKAVGTGFASTKNEYPSIYSNSDKMDIKFVKKRDANAENPLLLDHLMVYQTGHPAGIQVKAISTNFGSEIILPIIRGEYFKVVTCVELDSGKHSYEVCVEELKRMREKGGIDWETYHQVSKSIHAPEHIGAYQVDINYYQKFARQIYPHMSETGMPLSQMGVEESELASMEVSGYSQKNGILVPDNLDSKIDLNQIFFPG
jgi:hypothetical protein